MVDGMWRQMRQGGVSCLLQDLKGIRIISESVGIEQSQHELIVAIGWKPVLDVEVGADGLGVQLVQPQNFGPCGLIAGDGIDASECRHPLAEGAGRCESIVSCEVVQVRIVVVPTS